jgi:hypothetical protein
MALEKKTAEQAAEPVDTSIVLELQLYTTYNYHGVIFEKSKPYRFKREDAMNLLSEMDSNRQVWKMYRPAAKKAEVVPVVQDKTKMDIPDEVTELGENQPRRNEIGDDSEIADILDKVNSEGDVEI